MIAKDGDHARLTSDIGHLYIGPVVIHHRSDFLYPLR